MQKKVFLAILFLFILPLSGKSQIQREFHYIVPVDALDMQGMPEALDVFDNLALVSLKEWQVNKLSTFIHENWRQCGGFMAVEDEIEKGYFLEDIVVGESPIVPDNFYPQILSAHKDVEELFSHVSKESYQVQHDAVVTTFPNRYSNSVEGEAFSQYLVEKLNELASENGLEVEIKTQNVRSSRQKNVIAKISGVNSDLPGVLIGAHMDTICSSWSCRGRADRNEGADDDGSGVATVLETFRAIAESGLSFERDIYFAFYAAEERGLWGSKAMANLFRDNEVPLRAVIQFDMTSYTEPGRERIIAFVRDHTNDELTEFLIEVAQEHLELPRESLKNTRCRYACSDHASWNAKGYPAAFPFEDLSSRMNGNIHTHDDNREIVDYEKTYMFLKLSLASVAELAKK